MAIDPKPVLIDTHCHIDYPEFDQDRDRILRALPDCGLEYMINVGSTLAGSQNSVALAKQYERVFAVVGVHPHDAESFDNVSLGILSKLANEEKVVAIGETGLDYFKNYSPMEKQQEVFLMMLELAKEKKLPVVIHCRQAESDCIRIVKEKMPLRAVVHCFSGDEHFLKECLDLGFYVSFTANITYKKAQNLRDVLKVVPLQRLMLETDAPYLSPEGLRGKRNEPINVRYVAEAVASIKGLSIEEIARLTTFNAKTFFNLEVKKFS
ncbi:MAG: TatD family hydrolase [Candidatus Omnitrophota bacterium]|jgi:TatD DNase family protein